MIDDDFWVLEVDNFTVLFSYVSTIFSIENINNFFFIFLLVYDSDATDNILVRTRMPFF